MTPDTSAYYHAAYVVVALLYTGYALSIGVRARRVRERLRKLAERKGAATAHSRS